MTDRLEDIKSRAEYLGIDSVVLAIERIEKQIAGYLKTLKEAEGKKRRKGDKGK